MKIYTKTLTPVLLLMAVVPSGCAPIYDENHGSKVRSNVIMQAVNPNAVYEKAPVAALEGQKAEALMSRYRKEKAEVPSEVLLNGIGN